MSRTTTGVINYDRCLVGSGIEHRRKYCKTKFVFDEAAIQECEQAYEYC